MGKTNYQIISKTQGVELGEKPRGSIAVEGVDMNGNLRIALTQHPHENANAAP